MRSLTAASLTALLSPLIQAYPWALNIANGAGDAQGVSDAVASTLSKRQNVGGTCPVNLVRKGAAPYSDVYPSKYTGAKNGLPGTGKGGVLVPAEGDTAHAYVVPGSRDVRGPWYAFATTTTPDTTTPATSTKLFTMPPRQSY